MALNSKLRERPVSCKLLTSRRDRMKKTLTLGTLILGCCIAGFAQMGNPNQNSPASTPSTFPQDQTGQTPSNPATPSSPSAIPPDTTASGQTTQASKSQATTVDGCLSQSSDGDFMVADNAGNQYQLRGDTSKLSSYIGNEVRVDGIAMSSNASNAGAMSSDSGAPTSTATQLNVNKVRKVSDTCATK
jgi:hypothetical protein